MNSKVIYFTRTGNSKRIAEKIAAKLDCDLVKVDDHRNWNGFFGFIKAGFFSSTNRSVKIDLDGNLDGTDVYIVVTPLWAGGISPAIRAFLKNVDPGVVHLVVSSDGSYLKSGQKFKAIYNIANNENLEDATIDNLVTQLKG